MKKKVATTTVVLICAILTNCGGSGTEVTADPGTPSYAMQNLIKSVLEEDVDLYLSLLNEKARLTAESSREKLGKARFESLMKNQMGGWQRQWRGLSVTGEEIDGDKATVTLSDPTGDSVDVDLVEEYDGWKLLVME